MRKTLHHFGMIARLRRYRNGGGFRAHAQSGIRLSAHLVVITAGLVFARCSIPSCASAGDLIVNEALANEPGSTTTLEWVELLNWPDSGNGTVRLQGYKLVDGLDTTHLDTGLDVPPGGFIILARKPTGTGSFESIWGDNSGVWGDSPPESFPVLGAKISLRNTNDTVTLISPVGVSTRMIWSRDAGDGISIERIRPNSNDAADNFAFCRDPSGSTPGRMNSVFPVRGDLSIDSMSVSPSQPRWRDTLAVIIHLTNTGLGVTLPLPIEIWDDAVPSQTGDFLNLVATVWTATVEELATYSILVLWPNPRPGPHTIVARLGDDGNSLNNTAALSTLIRFSSPLVVVSEFLANPTIGGPDEWVEISNQAEFPINLAGARIGDSSGSSPLPDDVGMIGPGEFWVLAENETAFRSYYSAFDGRLIPIGSWHEFNNTGDRIRLIGGGGEIIDSFRVGLSSTFAETADWAASVDSSKATPGRENSAQRSLAGPFAVRVSPNPTYLSSGEPIRIEYQLQIGEQLTLKIFDRNGRLVRTIADKTPAATGSVPWDATDGSGARVRPGPYVLLARSDPQGHQTKLVIVVGP
jgi:hypothetical protein